MTDDAGDWILVIGQHRASLEATRIHAVVTGGGDRQGYGFRASSRSGRRTRTHQQADLAPRFLGFQTVERVARHHAGLAGGALVEVYLEGVLFSRTRGRRRHQGLVVRVQQRAMGVGMTLTETLDRTQLPVLCQKGIHQRLKTLLVRSTHG